MGPVCAAARTSPSRRSKAVRTSATGRSRLLVRPSRSSDQQGFGQPAGPQTRKRPPGTRPRGIQVQMVRPGEDRRPPAACHPTVHLGQGYPRRPRSPDSSPQGHAPAHRPRGQTSLCPRGPACRETAQRRPCARPRASPARHTIQCSGKFCAARKPKSQQRRPSRGSSRHQPQHS